MRKTTKKIDWASTLLEIKPEEHFIKKNATVSEVDSARMVAYRLKKKGIAEFVVTRTNGLRVERVK